MKNIILGNCKVEFDRESTLNWYAKYKEWGCECGHCRNFLEIAKSRALPKRIIEILDQLEIPAEKATYVCELFTDDRGVHYQFSYRLVGSIIENSDDDVDHGEGRCCHEPYPYGAPNFPEPHFDLEFYVTLPWVLDESQK